MFKKILIGLVILIVGIVVVIAVQPADYHIERSTTVATKPELVWAEISDFNKWQAWNPWQNADPTQKTTVEGQPGVVGHKTSWTGQETGKGSMKILEAKAPTRLGLELSFIEPFASTAGTAFDLQPEGDGVKVTWSMDGKNDFVGKFFSLVMDMDTMVGSQYDRGLADLKKIAEANAKKAEAEAEAAAAAAAAEAVAAEAAAD